MTLTRELLISLTLLNYFCLSRSLSSSAMPFSAPWTHAQFAAFSSSPTIKLRAARLCCECPQLSFPVNLLIHTTRTNVRAVQQLGVVDWIRRSRINWWFESLKRWPAWKTQRGPLKAHTDSQKAPILIKNSHVITFIYLIG